MFLIFVLTAAGGLFLVGLSVWPGLLLDVVFGFPWFLFWLPIIGVWTILIVILALGELPPRPKGAVQRPRWGVWSAVITAGTFGLLLLQVPRQVVFLCCRPAFAQLVDVAPSEREALDKPNGKLVGVYLIDKFCKDSRGGVYFRTHAGPDGIGPDTMSYGFAFRPNREGTPFGNARRTLNHISGDWYFFSASNDW